MKKVILASGSPRRRQILDLMGIAHRVKVSHVPEDDIIADPVRHVRHYAKLKARTVAGSLKKGLVIGADTVVVYRGRIYGKPASKADAARMLSALSGKRHQVLTGVAVVDASSGKTAAGVEVTDVYFRKLQPAEIRAYVLTGEPMDKAGAYGIQEKGCRLVKKVDGCYYNVVGLPVARMLALLDKIK